MIGRDQETRRLRVTNGTQSKLFGPEGSVPDYVSRQHARLTIDKNGEYVLENLKANNVTFVNGLCIETKRVTENDRIELVLPTTALNGVSCSRCCPRSLIFVLLSRYGTSTTRRR